MALDNMSGVLLFVESLPPTLFSLFDVLGSPNFLVDSLSRGIFFSSLLSFEVGGMGTPHAAAVTRSSTSVDPHASAPLPQPEPRPWLLCEPQISLVLCLCEGCASQPVSLEDALAGNRVVCFRRVSATFLGEDGEAVFPPHDRPQLSLSVVACWVDEEVGGPQLVGED